MTTEKAVDILIKKGCNNDEEDEALEKLVCKARAFDYIRKHMGMRYENYLNYSVAINVSRCDSALEIYDKRLMWMMKEAFKEDDE